MRTSELAHVLNEINEKRIYLKCKKKTNSNQENSRAKSSMIKMNREKKEK